MQKYVSPALVNYGLSKDLIKGDCNWGNENLALDSDYHSEFDYWFCGTLYACIKGTKCLLTSSGSHYYECTSDSGCTGS